MRLVATDPSAPQREFYLDRKRLSVGSAEGNDLRIAHPTVSRNHALIRCRLGRYTVTDLGSTNGTFINGRRISAPAQFRPGDELRFGGARFALVGAAAPMRSPLYRAGLVAGIAALCAIGFFATQYVMTWNRLEQAAEAPGQNPPPAPVPLNHAREVTPATVKARPPSSSVRTSAGSGAIAGPGGKAAAPAPVAPWLARLNHWRTGAGLAPVAEDPALSDGDLKHAVYLIKNYGHVFKIGGSIGAAAHTEDSSNRWFTPAGFKAAGASDETQWTGPAGPSDGVEAIDDWMATPFHRLWILNPLLHRVGYGEKCEAGACVALLNVIDGADRPEFGAPLKQPVRFPPPRATVPAAMASFEDEWPSPLTACKGYAFPVGIAVTLELGPMVDARLSDYSLMRDGTHQVEACGIDAAGYRNPDPSQQRRVVHVLRAQGAVVVIPKAPLEPGSRYRVSMAVDGDRYTWWFAVAR